MGRPEPTSAAAPVSGRPGRPSPTESLPTPEYLEARLAELADKAGIPGASIAVRVGDRTVAAAVGVLDVELGYPATTDSLFQIGSITKVWTATLIMQLVDEGLLDLDAPVRTYLPDFRLVDEDAAARLTTRQLLCHTGGFEGEIYDDHGPGDDAVARLVAGLATTGEQLFAPGEMFSYCNSGFDLLGRIVQVLTGGTWEAAIRERIITPLGITHVANDASESILRPTAIGHLGGPDGTPVKAPVHHMGRAGGPSGALLATSATDLLEFAAAHIRDGLLPDGTRLLSQASALAMRAPQTDIFGDGLLGRTWGLGWNRYDWPGEPVVGHDGGTIGQTALLRVVPSRGVSVALLTNGGALYLGYDLIRELLGTLAGVDVPDLRVPPAEPVSIDARYVVGRYESASMRVDIAETRDGLTVTAGAIGVISALVGVERVTTRVVPVNARSLIAAEPEGGRHPVYVFVGDGEQAEFLHMGRALRRVRDTETAV
ncbi:serine hydrolase domain-containing protein [Streptomyces sp. SID3343]|uniref:serine hydrolase domain-containing protein n=1 Tax=Streptomyces sp. SID3343 TaxID=2690260 RepID=UPI00136EB558|nr:serine hydrolase domain-containing protein [Streptomyces sp. SID3343]MYW01041.1 serine hydrolase [Streptomyces sp. SID3343]